MTAFLADANRATDALRRRIRDMPFNAELAAGTLSRDRFRFYILQDALYLVDFARALAIAGARAPDADAVARFAKCAEGAIVVERALHEGFFALYGLGRDEVASSEPSPTCQAYTSFLLAAACTEAYEVLIAALLPCFTVYREVGLAISSRAAGANPYRAWVDAYADPAFGATVDAVNAIVDRAAAEASAAQRRAMLRAFVRSTQYEWMFWDSAYRGETWPIAA
jgi:thiaminase (transcriptional activator TenA)